MNALESFSSVRNFSPETSSGLGEGLLGEFLEKARGSDLVAWLQTLDTYQLIGLLVALISIGPLLGWVGGMGRELASGHGNGFGEFLGVLIVGAFMVGGLSMISGELDIDPLHHMIEQNPRTAVIAAILAFAALLVTAETILITGARSF